MKSAVVKVSAILALLVFLILGCGDDPPKVGTDFEIAVEHVLPVYAEALTTKMGKVGADRMVQEWGKMMKKRYDWADGSEERLEILSELHDKLIESDEVLNGPECLSDSDIYFKVEK